MLPNVRQQDLEKKFDKKDGKNEEEILLPNVGEQKKDSKNKEEFLLPNVGQKKKDDKNKQEILLRNVAQQDLDKKFDKKDSKNEEEILLANVGEQDLEKKFDKKHGGSNKIYYILHPRVFIYCLMRAKNTHIYSQYFIMINEIFKYYNDLELLKRSKLLSIKDDKIDELILYFFLFSIKKNDLY